MCTHNTSIHGTFKSKIHQDNIFKMANSLNYNTLNCRIFGRKCKKKKKGKLPSLLKLPKKVIKKTLEKG